MRSNRVARGALALAVAAALGAVGGCSEEPAEQASAKQAGESAVVASPAPAAAAQAVAQPAAAVPAPTPPAPARAAYARNEGRVLQVLDAGGYTYLEIEHAGGNAWLANGKVAVQPGELVRWRDAAPMRNFHSKSLGRTFEEVWFVSTVVPPSSAAAAPPSGGRGRVVSVVEAGGYTYIEVEADGGANSWLAAPTTGVQVGETIAWDGGSTMRQFSSKTLGRTFDEIVFVQGVSPVN
jgi:hypothetical protein